MTPDQGSAKKEMSVSSPPKMPTKMEFREIFQAIFDSECGGMRGMTCCGAWVVKDGKTIGCVHAVARDLLARLSDETLALDEKRGAALEKMWAFFSKHCTKKVTLDGVDWFSWEKEEEQTLIKIIKDIDALPKAPE